MKNRAELKNKNWPNPAEILRGWDFLFMRSNKRNGEGHMKTTTDKITLLGALAFFSIMLFSQSLMASEISMSNSPAEQTGNISFSAAPGQTGSLSIFIDNNDQPAINSFQFNLTYNTSAMTVTSVVLGGASSVSTCNTNPASAQFPGCNLIWNTNTAGTVAVGYYSSTALPQTNGQQVLVVNYAVKSSAAAGNYNLAITGQMFDEPTIETYYPATSTASAYWGAPTINVAQPTVNSGIMTVSVSNLTLTAPGNQSATAGTQLSVPLSGTYSGSGTLSCSVAGLPNNDAGNCTITGTSNYTGTFTWTPSSAETGTFSPITFTVTDGTLSATQQVQFSVSSSSASSVIPGDVDGKGYIIPDDYIKVKNCYLSGTSCTFTQAQRIAADVVNGTGVSITSYDAQLIRQKYLNPAYIFPCVAKTTPS